MLKPSRFDSRYYGCPRCDWPLNPADDCGDGGVTCACGAWVPLPDPPQPQQQSRKVETYGPEWPPE
ncbi:MAG: hypothetical protein ACYS1A_15980 [Planctomycetota bacterium]|jgi:hypothetical protein